MTQVLTVGKANKNNLEPHCKRVYTEIHRASTPAKSASRIVTLDGVYICWPLRGDLYGYVTLVISCRCPSPRLPCGSEALLASSKSTFG